MRELVWLKYRFIGDAVMATPLLRAVHASPFSHLKILASNHLTEMFAKEPYASHVEATGRLKGVGSFFDQVRKLRAERFDRVFLVNRSARSALISRFAGIKIRVGHTTEGRAALLTHGVPYDTAKYEAACYGDLCRAVGVECDDSRVFLQRSDSLPARSTAIAIQPGSTSVHKAVRPEHFALLVECIRDRGNDIILLGGKDERSYGDALLAFTGPKGIVDLIGACTLTQTMARIAGVEKLFCGDTGLVHIGAALDTPTVSVFASTSASKWGHHYGPHRVIDVGSPLIENLNPRLLVQALERCD